MNRFTCMMLAITCLAMTACGDAPTSTRNSSSPAGGTPTPTTTTVQAPASVTAPKDSLVTVSSPGRNQKGTWKDRPTRTLDGLKDYAPQGPVALSRFGGWQAHRVNGTGFFSTTKIGERWWIVDPEGYLFLSQGLNLVLAKSNEAKERFGSMAAWQSATATQLKAAGFTTAGGWSSDEFNDGRSGMAHTVSLHIMESFARKVGSIRIKEHMTDWIADAIPVFHPDFAAFAKAEIAALPYAADDPWILGFFSDNELPFPVDLLDRCLKLDDSVPGLIPNREAAKAWVRDHVRDGNTANITSDDRKEFIAFAGERYYTVMRDALKTRYPNHLYLGSRLLALIGHIGKNEPFWRMIGKYQDIVSMNYYDVWGPDQPSVAKWGSWCGRPLMITEWYAKAEDVPGLANTGGAGFLVKTQEDRANYYQHFVLGCLEAKNIVGWHWFRYQDDPAHSERGDNKGGANKGIVNGDYAPYEVLFRKAGAVQVEAYRLTEFLDAR